VLGIKPRALCFTTDLHPPAPAVTSDCFLPLLFSCLISLVTPLSVTHSFNKYLLSILCESWPFLNMLTKKWGLFRCEIWLVTLYAILELLSFLDIASLYQRCSEEIFACLFFLSFFLPLLGTELDIWLHEDCRRLVLKQLRFHFSSTLSRNGYPQDYK
jgi:hypothetical protein